MSFQAAFDSNFENYSSDDDYPTDRNTTFDLSPNTDLSDTLEHK